MKKAMPQLRPQMPHTHLVKSGVDLASSPIISFAYMVHSDAVEATTQKSQDEVSPFAPRSSQTETTSSPESWSGNQLAYFEKYGYPSLPATAGQQYLSPQSPSPCEKLASKRSSNFQQSQVNEIPLIPQSGILTLSLSC